MTRKDLVAQLLSDHHWHPNYQIQSVRWGGCAGLKRLREYRTELRIKLGLIPHDPYDDYPIEKKRVYRDGKATGTFLYRLLNGLGVTGRKVNNLSGVRTIPHSTPAREHSQPTQLSLLQCEGE